MANSNQSRFLLITFVFAFIGKDKVD